MSGGFSFPPPPPPPPKPSPSTQSQGPGQPNDSGFQNSRGRGGFRGGQRGRGQHSGRGNNFSSRGSHHHQQRGSHGNVNANVNANAQTPQNNGSIPRTAAGHKRKLDVLRPEPDQKKKPGPPTAPAIPSFGTTILPPKPQSQSKTSPSQQQPPTNKPARSLGLIPSANGADVTYSDSEDDNADEEALYAELGSKLTFEHNGVVMSLNSQADVIAWKKERQRNWPTKARMAEKDEERRRIGEERKRLLRGAASSRSSVQRPKSRSKAAETTPKKGSTDSDASPTAVPDPNERAKRLDELRKKVMASSTKNREVKELSDQSRVAPAPAEISDDVIVGPVESTPAKAEPDGNLLLEAGGEDEAGPAMSEESSGESSSESSSDSSSDSDSDDDAPEEITSKATAPQEITSQKRPCRYFAASGYCRDGDACRFRHDLSAQTQKEQRVPQQPLQRPRDQISDPTAKKGIFERLKEQEEQEEDRLALQVIKYLGKAGFFEGPSAPEQE